MANLINTLDSDNNPIQEISYGNIVLNLYNRNYISSEDNILGYTKELNYFLDTEKIDSNNTAISFKTPISFKLNWDLFLTEDQYSILMDIYNMYTLDIKLDLINSSNIYSSNINNAKNLILVDNYVKDLLQPIYKSYKFNISSISKINNFFFREKKVLLKMEGETL